MGELHVTLEVLADRNDDQSYRELTELEMMCMDDVCPDGAWVVRNGLGKWSSIEDDLSRLSGVLHVTLLAHVTDAEEGGQYRIYAHRGWDVVRVDPVITWPRPQWDLKVETRVTEAFEKAEELEKVGDVHAAGDVFGAMLDAMHEDPSAANMSTADIDALEEDTLDAFIRRELNRALAAGWRLVVAHVDGAADHFAVHTGLVQDPYLAEGCGIHPEFPPGFVGITVRYIDPDDDEAAEYLRDGAPPLFEEIVEDDVNGIEDLLQFHVFSGNRYQRRTTLQRIASANTTTPQFMAGSWL